MVKLLSPVGMLQHRGFSRVFAGIVTTTLLLLMSASGASLDSIFFTEAGASRLTRMNPDGTDALPIAFSLSLPTQVVADPVARRVYFTTQNDGRVRAANYDGTDIQFIVQGVQVSGLALDSAAAKLYMIVNGSEIRRTNLDGSSPQTVINNLIAGTGLVIDPVNGKLIYGSNGRINRSNLDGSNVEALVVNISAFGLAFNPATNQLFYTSTNSGPGVHRVNLATATLPLSHGTQPPLVNFGATLAITVDPEANQLYFTAGSNAENLYRTNADGSDPVILAFNRPTIYGIALAPRKNRVLATLGLPAPGISDATYRSFGQAVVNSAGQAAFDTVLTSATGAVTKDNDRALWSTLGSGALTLVARENGPTGVTGVNIKSWSALHMANNLLVFRARLAGNGVTTADDDAICAWNGTTLRLVVREGSETAGFKWGSFTYPSINDRGQIVFTANFTSAGARGSGLFVTDPNGGDAVSLVARGGTVELDGTLQTVKSFTKRITNSAEGFLSNTGYTASTLKLTDGRTVLAVLAE